MDKEQAWMKLDNAAKIYPASMTRSWMALFRFSANLTEAVDAQILQQALDQTLRRFPAFAQRLGQGVFWYYLEPIQAKLQVQPDVGNPCVRMSLKENNGYMMRVRYYETRIAVEFFHVLADGAGALSFFKTLVAEYLLLKYDARIPRANDILDCQDSPHPGENEDAFAKYARPIIRSRKEANAYFIPGSEEPHFLHIITGMLSVPEALAAAKRYQASLTEFLTAILIMAIQDVQTRHHPDGKRHRPVKICVPVNLRNYYQTETVRNFSSFLNPGIEPKYGQYTLEETIRQVHGFMVRELDEKLLNARFSTNVQSERNTATRLMPLFLKTPVMKAVFMLNGDKLSSSTFSNLGNVVLPPEMSKYVRRLDALLGPLKRNRVACACLSYNGILYISFTRKIKETEVERNFFRRLVQLGLHVTVESNARC